MKGFLGHRQPCSLAFRRDAWGGGATYDGALDAGEDLAFLDALLARGDTVAAATGVDWVRARHAASTVRDARGGAEADVAARHVARRVGLPASTVAALRALR